MRVFVTGASGWIGSAVVPELVAAGHSVVGLARSEGSAAALHAAGATAVRGTLDDLDVLRTSAADSEGVIHLAFRHDIAFAGRFPAAVDADRRAIETVGEALVHSGRPFVIASGLLGLAPGRPATELDGREPTPPTGQGGGAETRQANALAALAFADRGVRSSVLRLPPTVYGAGDHGFMATLVGIARERGVSGYIGEGANRWPAVHRLDAARLFRLALEGAPAGSVLHAVRDEGVPVRTIAEVIGRHLGLPAVSVAPSAAAAHFGWLGGFLAFDSPASSLLTRERLGWRPTRPGLVDDLERGHYFRDPAG